MKLPKLVLAWASGSNGDCGVGSLILGLEYLWFGCSKCSLVGFSGWFVLVGFFNISIGIIYSSVTSLRFLKCIAHKWHRCSCLGLPFQSVITENTSTYILS